MKVLLLEMKSRLRNHRPNMGLARISTEMKEKGHEVRYHISSSKHKLPKDFVPDQVYISITFSWDVAAVIKIVKHMHKKWSRVEGHITIGGVATKMSQERLKDGLGFSPVVGCDARLDEVVPDRTFFESGDNTYIFTSRGCKNNCSFCVVPNIEPISRKISNWATHVDLLKRNVVVCDNNLLLAEKEHKKAVLSYLGDIAPREGRRVPGSRAFRTVEFDGGLDFRNMLDNETLELLERIRFSKFRIAFDDVKYERLFDRAAINSIPLLGNKSARGVYEKSEVYVLYSCPDTKDTLVDTLYRIYKLRHHYGLLPYVMRFIPLDAEKHKDFLAPGWAKYDAIDLGRWVNLRQTYFRFAEYIHYLGNRKEEGAKIIYEELPTEKLFQKYGLDNFEILDKLQFDKGFEHNKGLIETQIEKRNQNMERLRKLGVSDYFLAS